MWDALYEELRAQGKEIEPRNDDDFIVANWPQWVATPPFWFTDEFQRDTVLELIKGIKGRIYPVGRLDMDAEGLLLMTNDGEVVAISALKKFAYTKV